MYINESNLNFSSLTYNNKPQAIILHHLEANGWTVEDVNRCHKEDNGWAGIGYHFYVRKDGSIWRGRPENAQGAHCPGWNIKSIGICAEGQYMTDTMPNEQKKSIIELGIYIKNKYGISEIYRHGDVYNTDCPGYNYPFLVIKNSILEGKAIENNALETPITPKTDKLKLQIQSLIYWLNIDYSAHISRTDGAYIESELYPNLEAVGKLITLNHRSHLVQWIQQKLEMWGYLRKNSYTPMVYDSITLGAVTELQKNWSRETSGKILISNNTWQIFLQNE